MIASERAPLQQISGAQSAPPRQFSHAENDENSGVGSGSFSQMTQAFNKRIAELQQLACLRIEGTKAACAERLYVSAGAGRRRGKGMALPARC